MNTKVSTKTENCRSTSVLSVETTVLNEIFKSDAAEFARSQFPSAERAMAPHSSPLAWKIPWTEKPGGLQSMGSLGVVHDRVTSLSLFTFHFCASEKEWQLTPVFLSGESQGRGSLVGCPLWSCTELDTTEAN